MYREESNYDFRIIRTVYKGSKGKGITHIQIPSQDTGNRWKNVSDPVMIENKIIDRNIEHFGQAKNTPFASGELAKEYGYQGTNSSAVNLIH
jgi:hypothetical protein